MLQWAGVPSVAAEEEGEDVESVVVTAARSGQLVRDQPIRVEVVPDVEIEESLSVAPGNLTNLLNELAGARMQASAPAWAARRCSSAACPGATRRFCRMACRSRARRRIPSA